jgi:hypothetical protein
MSIATVEIRSFSGPDLVELGSANRPAIIRLNVGPKGDDGDAGPAGPNSVTSATTSDGTAELSVAEVVATASGNRIVGIFASDVEGRSGSLQFSDGVNSVGIIMAENSPGANLVLPSSSGTIALTSDIPTDVNNITSATTSDGTCDLQVASLSVYPNGGLSLASSNSGGVVVLNGQQATDARIIAFPDASGTVALTTSNVSTATALQTSRNIFGIAFNGTGNVTGDAVTTGHFASIPTGGTAGHFVTLNGTAPTVAAGRSAWWSDASGVPSFRNGTGGAVTLIRSSDLGAGVATALAITANATGGIVTTNGTATLTNKTLESATFTGTTMSRIHAMSMSQSPPIALFEDFNGALGAGIYAWTNSGTGSDAIGGIGPNVFGVRRMTTGGTTGNQRKSILSIPSASIFGTEIRAHFAIPDVTTCDAFIGMEQTAGAFGRYFLLYAAALNSGRWILLSGTGAGVFTNFGTNGPANGNFTSGKRYRSIMRPINATTVYVRIEEADWNGSTWTVMHDANVTITSYTPSADPMALDIRVNTQTSATRSLEIDYISAENQTVTR